MKPDSLLSQFQAVLTTYYKDIKEVQGASGCTKAKSVKCRFQDVDEAGDDAAAAAAPAADASAASAPRPPRPPAPRTRTLPLHRRRLHLRLLPAAQQESRRERAGRGPQRADAD